MALSGTVAANKDLTLGYCPLLLCAITLPGTSTPLLLSTHSLDGVSNPSFPGIGSLPAGNYIGRLSQQDIDALQHRSHLGIDRVARVTLHITDPDHFIYNNYCRIYGFRGATVRMALVLWQVGTTNFTSDAPLMFIGTMDMEVPRHGATVIEISANNSHNMASVRLPFFPIQNRCPLHFPSTDAEQTLSLDPASTFCIYSAAVGGVGNTGPANHFDSYGRRVTDSRGIYVSCDFLRSDPFGSNTTVGCMARLGNYSSTSVAPDGDIGHDQAGHWTGGFAGVQWSPGVYYAENRNYVSGGKIPTYSFLNAAILGQYQNLVYGWQFITAKVANIVESGNDTKAEAMIYSGEHDIGFVPLVVVNGIALNRFNHGAVDSSLGWDWATDGTNVSTGGRKGTPVRILGYGDNSHTALGDPYGSIARIITVVHKDIFTGFGTPTIQIRTIGPKVPVFTSQTVKTLLGYPYNSNPAWVTLDILNKSNWSYSEINMSTFISTANACGYGAGQDPSADKFGTLISYIDNLGNSNTHAAYACKFSLEQRRSAQDVLTGVLRACNGYLFWDQNGLLCMGINQTLADQQPSPITGSNYVGGGVSSHHADGTSGTGFPAYVFDESNIDVSSIEFEQNATSLTPNRISITFQDEDNGFVVDSLNEVDPHAVDRAGGAGLQIGGAVIDEALNVLGIPNFDQAIRIANTYIAERQYGNEAADARGTRILAFKTTVRCEHLNTGDLVQFSYQALGISNQLFRVLRKQVETDFQSASLAIQWHNDLWYTYAYGQAPEAFYGDPGISRPARPPLTWQPFAAQPSVASGELYPQLTGTEYNFALAEVDGVDASGSASVQLRIGGIPPINQINAACQPPRVPLQATIGSGGSILGGVTLLIQICGIDAGGNYTSPSQTVTAAIPAGSGYTVTISNIGWTVGTAGYDVFAGRDHYSITHQVSNPSSTPSSITLTALPNTLAYGPPDLSAGSLYAQAKIVSHGGIIGANVGAVTTGPNTITIGGATITNVLTGYKVLLIGRDDDSGIDLPIIEFNIVSNAGNVLTVDRDPTSLINVQDIVLVSAQADIATATSIGCTNFVNANAPTGVGVEDIGKIVRIIYGLGRYQSRTIKDVVSSTAGPNLDTYVVDRAWNLTPDVTSWFIVEETGWPDTTPTSNFTQQTYGGGNVALLNVSNYAKKTILVQVLIGDPTDALFSNEHRSPWRMMYLGGSQGTRTITNVDSPYTQQVIDGILLCDTSGGDVVVNLLPHDMVQNAELVVQKITSDANTVTINWYLDVANNIQETDENGDIVRQLTSDVPPNNKTVIRFHGN